MCECWRGHGERWSVEVVFSMLIDLCRSRVHRRFHDSDTCIAERDGYAFSDVSSVLFSLFQASLGSARVPGSPGHLPATEVNREMDILIVQTGVWASK